MAVYGPHTGKKVIMLLSNEFAPDPRVYNEAKSLVEHGYDVTVIAWDREGTRPEEESKDGINVERIHVRSYYGRGTTQILFGVLFWVIAFVRLIFRDMDIIHCHDFDTLPLGFLIGKIRNKKVIFDAHESFSDQFTSHVLGIVNKAMLLVEKILVRHVDLVVTVGEILRQEYIRRGAKRTCVVGNWKRMKDFQIPQDRIDDERKRLHILNGKLVVSCITWFNHNRLIFPLIEAAKRNDDVFVILAGDGNLKDKVLEAMDGCRNIVYLGLLSPEDVPIYTCLSDVVYYDFDPRNPNAKYSAPNKLFEALAAGKAIVTGSFGEIGRIVKEEKCGLVVKEVNEEELNNAFSLFYQTDFLCKCQSNAHKAAQRKYNWANAEQSLLEGYSRVTLLRSLRSPFPL